MRTPEKSEPTATAASRPRRRLNVAAILLYFIFFLFVGQLVNFELALVRANQADSLPVSIRATARANYSRDVNAPAIPPISGYILRQIITDIPATGSPQERIATLQVILTQPVPTQTAGAPNQPTPVTTPVTTAGAPTSVPPTSVPTTGATPVPTNVGQPTVQPTVVTPAPPPGPKPTKPPKPPKEPKPPKPPKEPKEPKAPKEPKPPKANGVAGICREA